MENTGLSEKLESQIAHSVRRLLSEQDRDSYSPTYGCFDRRYWAWKLTDFPEATFQRNVHALAQCYADPNGEYHKSPLLRSSLLAGLGYAARIQHRDGSFDQAFPQEHSFGATAFLLHAILEAYRVVSQDVGVKSLEEIERCLRRGAQFLCKHDEEHGHIANHLAGAVLSLLLSAELFNENGFQNRAKAIMDRILKHQSNEGWFLEYEGADPGYQTLCLYYLAHVHQKMPSPALREALTKAVEFLSYFLHPDGTFGGEYGSRRTAIFYPGGLALLSREHPLALAMTRAMCHSIWAGHTVTLHDMDMGNLAPLLDNYICTVRTGALHRDADGPPLPWERPELRKDFPEAGLHIRGTERYYAILGVSNGGILKVFDKPGRKILWEDCGYVGKIAKGGFVTTQMTMMGRPSKVARHEIAMSCHFYKFIHALPTPFLFLLLRFLSLTLMRSLRLGNVIKKGMVRMLISAKRPCPMELERRVKFESSRVIVKDRLSKRPRLKMERLEIGRKFISIHMASAKYFEGIQYGRTPPLPSLDVAHLNGQHQLEVQLVIESAHA